MEDVKIILAEDNDMLRKSLNFFLEQKGFKVDQFANGQEALDSIKVNNYDLILVDINIPGISGMEITQYVRSEMYLDTPIIIFTSSNVEQTEIDCFDIGADEFIAKPISPLVLITRINNLLKKKRAKIQYNLN
ncbi:response regulator transcription factor [Lacihabitans sp. CS3-21]|jgi:DNA-binding response OmpR family regulator|uniref:response regulator transcription factor n=1 Tax=Lacihabitans sp. CS3-21 TaxID=2487332 RepID=UPI0020CDB7BC|nr:response regulator transcription factor [Lacihabitans sp. CS3-21]MCP9749311.1 DNA-binding response regulator [Lacihabitans sp. CS3-21]